MPQTTSSQIQTLCKKLHPILGPAADHLYQTYLAEDLQTRDIIAQDIELLAEKHLKETPLENQQILLEPPTKEASKGQFSIGNIIYNRKKLHQLHLKPDDFQKQIGIFAITGEGKTNLAYLLALQLIKANIPFIVLDWKRSWRNLLTLKNTNSELQDVQVLTIGRETLPFLWNVFQAPPGTSTEYWIGTIADTLEKSHLSGPGVAYYFNKIYSKLFKGLPDDFYPNFYDGLKELKNIKVYGREANWKQTAQRIFQSFTLGPAKDAFNTRNPIKLESLLNKPVILELDLEMPKPLRTFLSEIILRWIHLYRVSQGETDTLKHVLFLEEAHNLFTKSGYNKENKSIENLYREIRGFGQGIVSITQHPSLLPIELLGNCHTQIYLGLQHKDDIEMARKSLFIEPEEEPYFNILNVGECIVKIKNRIEPCLVKTPLVPVQKEVVTDDWLIALDLGREFNTNSWGNKENYLYLKKSIQGILGAENVASEKSDSRNISIEKNTFLIKHQKIPANRNGYSIAKPTVQAGKTSELDCRRGILSPVNRKDKKRKPTPKIKPKQRLLVDIFNHPFSSITRRYKRLKMYHDLGNKCRKDLIFDNCILPRRIITGKGWITLFEVTKKGKLLLQDLGFEFKNESEGIVHKYWKHTVAEFYRNQSFDVRVEKYYVNGRPDIIVVNGDKKVAIEIETGKSNYVGNIERALEAGFDEVICLAVNRFVEDKILRRLRQNGIEDEKVRVVNVKTYNY